MLGLTRSVDDAAAQAAALQAALKRRQKGATDEVLADSAAMLAAAAAELEQLETQNRQDGEPPDDATDAIKAAQVALFSARGMREELAADPSNRQLHQTYMSACSNVTDLVASAGVEMRRRRKHSGDSVLGARRRLATAVRNLEDLKQGNHAAGIPVDEATDAIEAAVGRVGAANELYVALERNDTTGTGGGMSATLVTQFIGSVDKAVDAVEAATNAMKRRALRVLGGGSVASICEVALKRLHETEKLYQTVYRTFTESEVLATVPVIVEVMNMATVTLEPARGLRPSVFASMSTDEEHRAAARIQALQRGREARARVKRMRAGLPPTEVTSKKGDGEGAGEGKVDSDDEGAKDDVRVSRKKVLPPCLPLDKQLDNRASATLGTAKLSRVPTSTLVVFVDAVSSAEIAVKEAARVIAAQSERHQVIFRAAADERRHAEASLQEAERNAQRAAALVAEVRAQAKQAQAQGGANAAMAGELAREIAAASMACKRADKAVASAKTALATFDESVNPSGAEMVRLVDATAHASALASVALDRAESLRSLQKTSARGRQMRELVDDAVGVATKQLRQASGILQGCNGDIARMQAIVDSSSKADAEGMQALSACMNAVAKAEGSVQGGRDFLEQTKLAAISNTVTSAQLDRCRTKASIALTLSTTAQRLTSAAMQHFNLHGAADARALSWHEADAAARLKYAEIMLEGHARDLNGRGNVSGDPQLLAVHDQIGVATRKIKEAHYALMQYRTALAADDNADTNPNRATVEARNSATVAVADATVLVEAIGDMLRGITMNKRAAAAAHTRAARLALWRSRRPMADGLLMGQGHKSRVAALLTDQPTPSKIDLQRGWLGRGDGNTARSLDALDLPSVNLKGAPPPWWRYRLSSRLRAWLYLAGHLHGSLLSAMRVRWVVL